MSPSVKVLTGLFGAGGLTALALGFGCAGDHLTLNPLSPQEAESRRLAVALDDARERSAITEVQVSALIAGRVRLVDAAREFLAAHEKSPAISAYFVTHYPDQTPLEHAARDLANRAHVRVGDQGAREQLAQRLTAEFAAQFPTRAPLELEPYFAPPVPTHRTPPVPPKAVVTAVE
jgi:hypothetical protein